MAGINNVDVDWVDDSNETPLCSKSDFKLCSALHCDQVSNSLLLIQGIRFLLSILVHFQDDVYNYLKNLKVAKDLFQYASRNDSR